MMYARLSRILILSIMIVGLMMLSGCNQSNNAVTLAKSDRGLLLGSWSNDEGMESSVYTFEKEYYTLKFGESFVERGSYSLNDGTLTKMTTHLYSEAKGDWVSREEFEKHTGADSAVVDSMYETLNYAVSISEDSLIFTPHPDDFDMSELSQAEILSEYTLKYTRL